MDRVLYDRNQGIAIEGLHCRDMVLCTTFRQTALKRAVPENTPVVVTLDGRELPPSVILRMGSLAWTPVMRITVSDGKLLIAL